MTPEQAAALRSFKNYCTCGGYAAGLMNDRNPRSPHMSWCPQHDEYLEWRAAMDIYEGKSTRQEGAE